MSHHVFIFPLSHFLHPPFFSLLAFLNSVTNNLCIFSSDESESEEDIPLTIANNGKTEAKPKQQEKPVEVEKSNAAKNKESGSGKQKVKIVEPSKDVEEEDDESSDEDLMSEDSDEDDLEDEDDSDDSDESDVETPKKVEPSKKRAAESVTKTPAAYKKAKATPQKTGTCILTVGLIFFLVCCRWQESKWSCCYTSPCKAGWEEESYYQTKSADAKIRRLTYLQELRQGIWF